MSGQSDPGGGGGDKNAYSILWVVAGLFTIGFVLWYFFEKQIIYGFLWVKKMEALAISFFTPAMGKMLNALDIAMANPTAVTLADAGKISHYIGEFLVYPMSAIMVLMALYLFKNHIAARFNKTYNMNTLVEQEKVNWPQIYPVAGLDLVALDINEGPWSMAMNPMQFGKKYDLLKVEIVPDRKAMWRSEGIPKATVIKDKALRVFASQLGPLWAGPDKLPPHTKALFAAFLARAEHDTDAAYKYLHLLSEEAAKGEMTYPLTDEYLKKYGNSKAARRCVSIHAYVLTVMASMMELARVDGVLASAEFLWVKPLDRHLWYTLNTVGRQVAPAEVAGIFAHWVAEKEMHRPLSVPMVEEAYIALDKAIENIIYVPDEVDDGLPPILPEGDY